MSGNELQKKRSEGWEETAKQLQLDIARKRREGGLNSSEGCMLLLMYGKTIADLDQWKDVIPVLEECVMLQKRLGRQNTEGCTVSALHSSTALSQAAL